ncbi:interleukin-36 receptor antagonist protein-like isoform X2 [Melanerpes formicivorus]
MSHTRRSAARGAGTHRAQRQLQRTPPPGMVAEGTEHRMESVIDPDMEALFKEFLDEVPVTAFSEEVSRRRQPYHYLVRDTEQKGLCLHDGRLVATSLQGANSAQEELISVVPNIHLDRQRCPLIVGIRGGTQALSCGTGPEPQLKLEAVELMELFSRREEATPCTFYKTFSGSTHTFEAAAFPGHFLSTTAGHGEPLTLAPPPHVTSFYLSRK